MDNKKYAMLSEFLKHGRPEIRLSANERSLEIFGDEKYLMSEDCRKFLKRYGIPIEVFNIYFTPEPFIYFCNYSDTSKNALIVENKDTWYSMRKILMQGKKIFDLPVKALIYGEGRKIQSSLEYMNEDDTLNIHSVDHYYYFGDIDASGIDIFYKLKKKYPEFKIEPFEDGYRYLYQYKEYGRTKDLTRHVPLSLEACNSLSFFTSDELNDIYTFCNHDYIIPQELLNIGVLNKVAA